MLFSFLKSTEVLEKELRQWFFEYLISTSPEEQSTKWLELCAKFDLKDLVREVASVCYSMRQQVKISKQMFGTEPNHLEVLQYLYGSKLAQDIAKRKKWELVFQGLGAGIYSCEIREI